MNRAQAPGRVAPAALLVSLVSLGCQPESPAPVQCELAPPTSVAGTWKTIPFVADSLGTDGETLVHLDLGCSYCSFDALDPASGTWQKLSVLAPQKDWEHGGAIVATPDFYYFDLTASPNEQVSVLYDRASSGWSITSIPDGLRARPFFRFWTGRELLAWGAGHYDTESGALHPDTPTVQFYDGVLFDPATGEWRQIPPARDDVEYRWGDGGPSVLSTWTQAGLFVWATNPERTENWGALFDVEAMAWEMLDVSTETPPLLDYGQLLSLGDAVFLFGGRPTRSAPGTYSRAIWRFSLTKKTWSKEDIPTWADPQLGTVIRDRLAFAGRCRGGQLYDPARGTWKPLPPQGANPQLGSVPRAAGSFLTVTDEIAHSATGQLWILDLRQELGE